MGLGTLHDGSSQGVSTRDELIEQRTKHLCEDDRTLLDQKMNELLSHLEDRPQVTFTYFVPDALKKGGSYKSSTGIVQKVDDYTRTLTLEGGAKVEIGRIIDVDSIE